MNSVTAFARRLSMLLSDLLAQGKNPRGHTRSQAALPLTDLDLLDHLTRLVLLDQDLFAAVCLHRPRRTALLRALTTPRHLNYLLRAPHRNHSYPRISHHHSNKHRQTVSRTLTMVLTLLTCLLHRLLHQVD
jgi:hypothetical protein